MSTKARITGIPRTPVVTSRTKTRSLPDHDGEEVLSPVQRMRQKISLPDPEMVRHIIFDPTLES